MMKRFDFVYIFYLLVLLSPLCIAFEISGTVSSSQSLQDVSITATNKANGMVYNTISSEGKYSLDVPAGSFSFLASPRDYFILSDWVLPSLFSVELDLDVVQDSTLNFEFEPCFTLVAQAFDSHGNVLNYTDFSSFAWATDMNQVTARATTLEVFSVGGASSTLGFSIPLGEKRIIMSQFFVMNVGNFVMQASNGTSGFSGSEEKRGEVINLNYEFAKDAFENLNEKLNSEDYKTLSTDFQSLQDLNALMGSAHDASSPSSQAEIANQVIAKAISIEDDAEMKRAARDIDLYRTSQINVKVSDENGKPVEGITVRVEQQDHEFRFGLYGGQIPEGRERLWKLMASAGINSATVDFWWIDTEPTAENVNASYVLGQKIDFLKSLGLKLRATGLFQPDPEIIPSYALQMTFDEFSRSLYNHTFNLVSTYCKEFELIEVSTDLNTLAVKMGYNSSQVLQLQQVALDAIKKAAPNVKTSVSMFNDYFAQSAFESFKGPSTSWDKTTLSPLAFSKLWIDAGQSIDQIGQQMYNGGNRAAIGSPQQQYDPSFSLGTLSAQLDKLSTFGKPIRVSEVAVPGVWGGNWDPSEAGFLGTVWDEESQANFITKFYTMAFSKKANKEITWWGLFDEAFAYPGGTFLDSEGQPKKGYQNLISLIKSWTTDSKVASNAQGQGKVKAFAGTYKVSAFSQGNMIGMSEMKFTEGKTLPLLVRINSKGKALFSQNPSDFNVEVVNPVAPAPIGTPIGQVGDNSPSKKMPTWAIPVVIVSGLLVISAFALLIVFIVVRRRIASERNNVEGSETPTKESKDVGLAAQDSVKYESDLEAGSDLDRRESIEGTPATWMGQPLSTVPLDESESDGESGRESETEGEREEVLSGGEKFFTAAEYFPNKESSEEERNSEDEDEEEEEEQEEGEQKEEEESECDEALNEKQDESEGTSSEEEKL